jgi:arabinogalactan oligomer/maltooligosaccharide transport system substrate-binding protein
VKRHLRLASLVGAVTIIVTACSGSSATPSPSVAAPSTPESMAPSVAPSTPESMAPSVAPSAGSASLVIWADDLRSAAIKPLAQAWAQQNGVTVDVEDISKDITTKFKTASQQGTGPDIVVWAADAIGDFVQNGAIDPIQMSDTSMFDPLAVKGMTFNGQLYGIPYSVENIALIRNTDLAPTAPATMEDLVSAGQALVKAGKVKNIMALQVGQQGDAYHIYPLFTSGGGSFFGLTATGDPDPSNVTVDSAGSIAAGQKLKALGEKGVGALTRSIDGQNAIPTFTGKKTAFLVSGPWAIPDVKKAGFNYDISAVPPFASGQPASVFIGTNGFYLASKGKNKALAEEFLTTVVPTLDFQMGLYNADPRRPALTAASAQVTASDPNIPKFAAAASNGTILPAIPAMGQVWAPFGTAEANIVGGADPATALAAAAKAIRDGIASQ